MFYEFVAGLIVLIILLIVTLFYGYLVLCVYSLYVNFKQENFSKFNSMNMTIAVEGGQVPVDNKTEI